MTINQTIYVSDLLPASVAQHFRLLLLCAKTSARSTYVIRVLTLFDDFMTGKHDLQTALKPSHDTEDITISNEGSTCSAFLAEAAWFLRQQGGVVASLVPWVDALLEKERCAEQKPATATQLPVTTSRCMQSITLAGAKTLAHHAEIRAREINVPMSIAVVDVSCNLVLHQRMEDALQTSVIVALDKAYSAASFKIPTWQLADMVQPGASLYGIQHNDPRLVVFGGGYPIRLNNQLVGGFGVAGGAVEEDMDVAQYALKQAMDIDA